MVGHLAGVLVASVVVVSDVMLRRSVFGRYLVGIGTNEEAMSLAGIDPRP